MQALEAANQTLIDQDHPSKGTVKVTRTVPPFDASGVRYCDVTGTRCPVLTVRCPVLPTRPVCSVRSGWGCTRGLSSLMSLACATLGELTRDSKRKGKKEGDLTITSRAPVS
eukprot:304231-Rhodomonas_salina.3